jgi:hypothetical protein
MPGDVIDLQRPRRRSVQLIGDWKRNIRDSKRRDEEIGSS